MAHAGDEIHIGEQQNIGFIIGIAIVVLGTFTAVFFLSKIKKEPPLWIFFALTLFIVATILLLFFLGKMVCP